MKTHKQQARDQQLGIHNARQEDIINIVPSPTQVLSSAIDAPRASGFANSFSLYRMGVGNYYAIAVLAIVVLSIPVFLFYQRVRGYLQEGVERLVFTETEQDVERIDTWLALQQTRLRTMAASSEVRTMHWGVAEGFLLEQVARQDDIKQLALISSEGYLATTDDGELGRDVWENGSSYNFAYIQRALDGEFVITRPYNSTRRDGSMILFAIPIYGTHHSQRSLAADQSPLTIQAQLPEQVIGVLTAIVNAQGLQNRVNALGNGRDSFTFIFDHQLEPIIEPQGEEATSLGFASLEATIESFQTQNRASVVNQLAEHMTEGTRGMQRVRLFGNAYYIAYVPLTQTSWSVARILPTEGIEAPLQRLDFVMMAFALLAFMALFLVWRFRRFEQKQLQLRKEAAEAANRAKSEFFANMSHELRTPMNAVLGFAQLLQHSNNLSVEEQQYLNFINQGGEHLLSLINDVLDMSKIEAGRMVLTPYDCDIHQSLQALLAMMQPRAKEKGLQLSLDYHSDTAAFVHVDEGKLRQVVLNLLSNAVKYTDEGYVRLEVSLHAHPQDTGLRQLTIAVHDSGSGISATEQRSLFDPFVQTASGLASRGGTGLGLSISQRFVQLMGGRIMVQSQPGQGSSFTFSLDVAAAAVHEASADSAQNIVGLAAGQPALRVLVAESHSSNRTMLTNLLEHIGFEVYSVGDGQSLLEQWQRYAPDAIIMTMRLPTMNGYAVMKAIGKQVAATGCRAPMVIGLSSEAFESDKARILKAGCNEVLCKPLNHQQLLERLGTLLAINYRYQDNQDNQDNDNLSISNENYRDSYSDSYASAKAEDAGDKPRKEINTDDIAALPSAWREELQRAVRQADSERALALLENQKQHYPRVVAYFEKLIHDFAYDVLLRYLSPNDPSQLSHNNLVALSNERA